MVKWHIPKIGGTKVNLSQSYKLAKQHGFHRLITLPHHNAKLKKSQGYYNAGITFAQHTLSGYNVCPASTVQCRLSCLGQYGYAEVYYNNVLNSRINRTKLYINDKEAFWDVLEPQLYMVERKAKQLGLPVAFRPNITSDIAWWHTMPQLFSTFPHWQFYGYTKVKKHIQDYIMGKLPPNYYLTYSRSEHDTDKDIDNMLKNNVNVAVPFFDKTTLMPFIPTQWRNYQVINGDESDLRFKDPTPAIVGLKVKLPKSKSKAQNIIKAANGFFVGVTP